MLFANLGTKKLPGFAPPIKEITRIIKKIRISKMSGILFVPEWQTADFWIEIFKQNQALKWPFTQFTKHVPFIVQKEHNHKSPFAGRVNFNFLAIKFETY